ncbi:hypothetical protein Poli38472_006216 [Pythium oligandrum]|uniref:6-phosphofructo-2-kinase domain-containing protein n=1 Tax=Pythium oligandrum TaxID=41045 RepID=A0A8K1CTP0_PYTOL|nr:hypothetical protein Poli38472_006216 [Pythium oligandrum]|eukprot:TMW68748.1 hypothetical protein Poli38472_006216 [Pythium oligandrum]
MVKVSTPWLTTREATLLAVSTVGVLLTWQVLRHRETLRDALASTKQRALFWKSMRRRFENQRLNRLSSVGEGRRSNWMWQKTTESDDESDDGDSKDSTDGLMTSQKKLVLVMVGLPARGKSFVVHKATRYIEWLGFPTKIFNVGNYRRKLGRAGEDANFFSADNADAKKLREEMAMVVLDDLIEWLEGEGHVAVFDATNTTKIRRESILERVRSHDNIRVMFVESICDKQDLLEANYRRKLINDDYTDKDPEQALADFVERVHAYEKVYQTVEDTEDEGNVCYVKVYNAGEKIQARFCQGFLQSHIVSLLENIHLFPRRIWLVRPGPSITSRRGILGLDTDLAFEGHQVAMAIANFVDKQHFTRPFEIWTSAMKRSRQTAKYVPTKYIKRFVATTLLNELGGGDFEGLTYTEIKNCYPKHYHARKQDKLHYRYPGVGGESYVDVISRLRSLIIEFERKKRDVLVICDESILRCLLGYFVGIEAKKVPYQDSYENTVIELSPHRDGCDMKLIPLDLEEVPREMVDTQRLRAMRRTMST